MITVIHGDDEALSREYFQSLKSKVKDALSLSSGDILSELIQFTSGGSLFSDEKSVFIENLLSAKKQSGVAEVIDYIKKNHDNLNLYLWEKNELSKSALSQFPNPTIKLFKLPQKLFNFLDGLMPKNPNNVKIFHEALENSNEELLLFMVIRQFRLMLSVRVNAGIDETKRLAPWQQGKIKKQADKFGERSLVKALKELHKIDHAQKMGLSNLNTIQAVDIFLLSV